MSSEGTATTHQAREPPRGYGRTGGVNGDPWSRGRPRRCDYGGRGMGGELDPGRTPAGQNETRGKRKLDNAPTRGTNESLRL